MRQVLLRKERKVLLAIVCVIAAVAVFFVLVMIYDCNRFVIKEYEIVSHKLKRDETLVLLSDLHSKSFGKKNSKLKEAVDQISPDKILVAGDMYTAATSEDSQVAEDLVCYLAGRYPVYCGNGNHEHKSRLHPEVYGDIYERYSEAIRKAGARHLVNQKAELPEDDIVIYGSEIDRAFFAKMKTVQMEASYMEEILGKADKEKFSVLIAHNPDYFESYAGWGADLVVAGHVHGGLMRLPVFGGVINPALRLFPKYDGGRFALQGSVMILGRGLGTHTLPIRIFNPGELVVIHCKAVPKVDDNF